MWILATWGPLMPSLRKNCPKDDPRTIQVRFRRVKDAHYFQQHYLSRTVDFDSEIITNAGTDYDARVYVRPASLESAMTKLVSEIDYTSFKDQTEVKHKDKQLHDAYYAVWRVLYDRLSTRKAFSRPWRKSDWRGNRTTGAVIDEATHWVPTERRVTQTEVVEWKRYSELTAAQRQELWEQSEVERRERRERDQAMDQALREQLVENALVDAFNEVEDSFEEDPIPQVKNGRLDHSTCSHAHTKSARRRCRKQWMR